MDVTILRDGALVVALDDFGRRLVERLVHRFQAPPSNLLFYPRFGQAEADNTDPDVRVCQRYGDDRCWHDLNWSITAGTAEEVFVRAVGTLQTDLTAEVKDLVLVVDARLLSQASPRRAILGATERLRRGVEALKFVSLVAGGDIRCVAAGELIPWIAEQEMDFLVLAPAVAAGETVLVANGEVEEAAAAAIYALAFSPTSELLKERLTLGRNQLEQVGQVVSLGLAEVRVDAAASERTLQDWLFVHLASSLAHDLTLVLDSAVEGDERWDKAFEEQVLAGEETGAIDTRWRENDWKPAVR